MNVHGPLAVAPVIDRLRLQLAGVDVRQAADLATLADSALPDRIAIVLPAREAPQARESSGAQYRQPVLVDVSLLLGARGYGDPLDFTSASDIQGMVTAARQAVLNWRHPDARTVFGLSSGALQQVDPDGLVWWLETYSCTYWLEIQ